MGVSKKAAGNERERERATVLERHGARWRPKARRMLGVRGRRKK